MKIALAILVVVGIVYGVRAMIQRHNEWPSIVAHWESK